jgi:modification methylase
LLKRVILSTTKQDNVVLDPFFGTGTTGAVAKKLGRKFVGIEREGIYIQIAKTRIESINNLLPKGDLIEMLKEEQPKVPFVNLVRKNIIGIGEFLYTPRKYNKQAEVLSDGNLHYEDTSGSIHKIGAIIQQTSSCNGWKFWYVFKNSKLLLLDDLRMQYIKARNA